MSTFGAFSEDATSLLTKLDAPSVRLATGALPDSMALTPTQMKDLLIVALHRGNARALDVMTGRVRLSARLNEDRAAFREAAARQRAGGVRDTRPSQRVQGGVQQQREKKDTNARGAAPQLVRDAGVAVGGGGDGVVARGGRVAPVQGGGARVYAGEEKKNDGLASSNSNRVVVREGGDGESSFDYSSSRMDAGAGAGRLVASIAPSQPPVIWSTSPPSSPAGTRDPLSQDSSAHAFSQLLSLPSSGVIGVGDSAFLLANGGDSMFPVPHTRDAHDAVESFGPAQLSSTSLSSGAAVDDSDSVPMSLGDEVSLEDVLRGDGPPPLFAHRHSPSQSGRVSPSSPSGGMGLSAVRESGSGAADELA